MIYFLLWRTLIDPVNDENASIIHLTCFSEIPGHSPIQRVDVHILSVFTSSPTTRCFISFFVNAGCLKMLPANSSLEPICLSSKKLTNSFLLNPAPSLMVKGKPNQLTSDFGSHRGNMK